ncbi:hypothetical protein SYNPS1DRAFT_22347 [Syncephalis pseudoplumigaleata]|uniref:Uncharacterized protein n=1 Tax=Syncephalis pseudoplumigaleata TaxID=1712513 RepID=A0A4V1J1P2_9FUNG|nr:hypothetical protein SYNPS1DRAFT_22347 [Syncephalis pseudoplumigaleata]|eukprot:RKP25749.1 hypothetical protein SYNPS1DRAFT_22347 [Syncephalis pseudoplumigaleata]
MKVSTAVVIVAVAAMASLAIVDAKPVLARRADRTEQQQAVGDQLKLKLIARLQKTVDELLVHNEARRQLLNKLINDNRKNVKLIEQQQMTVDEQLARNEARQEQLMKRIMLHEEQLKNAKKLSLP